MSDTNSQPTQPTQPIEILLFARAAEVVGQRRIQLHVAPKSSLAHVASAFAQEHPALETLLSASRWAIDGEFVDATSDLPAAQDGAILELALIPPVSGG